MQEAVNPDVWFPGLGIKINELSNVAVSIFGFPLYFYGIFIGLGVIAGAAYAAYNAKRTGQYSDNYIDFLPYAILFGLIGARIYYIVFSWPNYKNDLLKIFAFREGGLAIYGTVIGASLAAFFYAKIKKINLSLFLDTAVPGLALGQAIGRWGNFFNREAFGGYTDSVFAMRYRISDMLGYVPESLSKIEINNSYYIQVHPTFLYESVWNLCVFILLHIYTKKKRFNSEVFALYMFFYGLGRAWIEGLRTDQLLIGSTGLAASQVLSIVLVIGSFIFIVIRRSLLRKTSSNKESIEYLSPFSESLSDLEVPKTPEKDITPDDMFFEK